ncbi:MAG: hypothetical protein NUV91_01315 [Candidatus Omnitrophica bacterium]|nr:hypothetical protein [Candidatus Omnitrophota bacterium]
MFGHVLGGDLVRKIDQVNRIEKKYEEDDHQDKFKENDVKVTQHPSGKEIIPPTDF